MTSDEKGSLAVNMVSEHKVSQLSRALKAVSLPQSTSRYKRKRNNDDERIRELQALVENIQPLAFGSAFTGCGEKTSNGTTNVFTGYILH